MRNIFCFMVVLAVGLFFSTTTAWAGWVVTYSDSESGEQSKEYYQGGKGNFDSLIYDGRNFIVVSHESDSYWKGSPDKYCNALKKQRKQMEAQFATLPEQYRPKPLSGKNITRKKTSTETIAGFKATGYDFFVDGSPHGRVWVSRDSRLSGLIKFGKNLSGKMKCIDGMEAMSIEGTRQYKDTVKSAFIVKESHRQVVSFDKQSVSSNKFAAPSGYKSFSDYQSFMNHIKNNSRSSASSPSSPPIRKAEGRDNETKRKSSQKQEDNVVVKDAKEIADDSVDEAHQETKKGIKKEVSKDIKKGVNKFLKKLF